MSALRIPDNLRAELDATGLPWEITAKSRHRAVVPAGRLVGILPMNPRLSKSVGDRSYMNLLGQIRRAAKELKQ